MKPQPALASDRRVAVRSSGAGRRARGRFEQDECRKLGELDPVDVDQGRLEPAVGEERPVLELRQSWIVVDHRSPLRSGMTMT